MTWQAIVGFRLVVADLDAATAFYRVLGFSVGTREKITSAEMGLLSLNGAGLRQALTLGPSHLDLDAFEVNGRPYPADADAASLCFQHCALVTSDIAASWLAAQQAGAALIGRDGPITLPASAGGVTAVKFRDHDGHPLEFLQFPNDAAKGWTGESLLGIDHSAISVSDIAASVAFYERNGLYQDKGGFNHGPTQVALDGLDHVAVDVVPLRPWDGKSHLELLGYRRPRGRSFGPLRANDIAATRIVWRGNMMTLVRDPDEHLHQIERE